ncbi:MAG: hypothetical protein ACOYBH_02005 [Candidatus Alectryocaccobium sp.]|jgi:hypothetical protein
MEEKIQEFEAVLKRLKYNPQYVHDVICCIRKMYFFGEPTMQSVEDYIKGLTRTRGNMYMRSVIMFKKWCVDGKDPVRRERRVNEIDEYALVYEKDSHKKRHKKVRKKVSKERAYIYRDSHSVMFGGWR